MSTRKEYNDRWTTPLAEESVAVVKDFNYKEDNAIMLTRQQFEELYGECPDELWEILVNSYNEHIKNK